MAVQPEVSGPAVAGLGAIGGLRPQRAGLQRSPLAQFMKIYRHRHRHDDSGGESARFRFHENRDEQRGKTRDAEQSKRSKCDLPLQPGAGFQALAEGRLPPD
jgi:hypothetical protein